MQKPEFRNKDAGEHGEEEGEGRVQDQAPKGHEF